MSVELSDPRRADFVLKELCSISKTATALYLKNGLYLREFKENGYCRQFGHDSFDECIQALHESGQLDYGPRNARNFIAVLELKERQLIPDEDFEKIGISKLREIATIKDAGEQRKLLEAAPETPTAEVAVQARQVRNKEAGRDIDPLHPYSIMTTKTQREFFTVCLKDARRVYAIDDNVPDAVVLVDHILADWHGHVPIIEAEAIEVS